MIRNRTWSLNRNLIRCVWRTFSHSNAHFLRDIFFIVATIKVTQIADKTLGNVFRCTSQKFLIVVFSNEGSAGVMTCLYKNNENLLSRCAHL